MKFTWKALILAPLIVPCVFSALLMSPQSKSPVLGFFVIAALGSFFSYGATACLFLPCLYVLSKLTALKMYLTCILGTVLGAVIYFPFVWISFTASGINSGPPEGTFVQYLLSTTFDPINLALFPGAGLVTALAYWILVNIKSKK